MEITLQHGMPATIAAFQLMNFQPVPEVTFKQPSLWPGTSAGTHFKPCYKISDGKLVEISSGLTNELETVGSLIEIGNILFKDSRDITQDEAAIMHTYFKRKYKKA